MSPTEEMLNDLGARIETIAGVTVSIQWVPEIERQELTTRQLILSPESCVLTMLSRGSKRRTVVFWLAIVEPLKQGNESSQASDNQELADLIAEGLIGKKTGGTRDAMCVAVEQPILAVPEQWRELRAFSTLLKITLEMCG